MQLGSHALHLVLIVTLQILNTIFMDWGKYIIKNFFLLLGSFGCLTIQLSPVIQLKV